VSINRVQEFQDGFLRYVDASFASLRQGLAQKHELTPEFESQLKQALTDFKAKVWKK
jgi:hypothetical protein